MSPLMPPEFWLRVLFDVACFILVMNFLFWWYTRKKEKPFEWELTNLNPAHLRKIADCLHHAADHVESGHLTHLSGGIILSNLPGVDYGLELKSNLCLTPSMRV